MHITWCGHASFLITSDTGIKILTDPYEPGGYDGALSYGSIPDEIDIAVVSHDHPDHNYIQGLKGRPRVVKGAGSHTVDDITFTGIATYHDTSRGKEGERALSSVFTIDGIRLCHLGDLGHSLNAEAITEIGDVDVLMIPVGGFYTIDAAIATEVMNALKPRLTIPMHFKTEKCAFPISTVDDFIANKTNVKRLATSTIEVSAETLPSSAEIDVLTFV